MGHTLFKVLREEDGMTLVFDRTNSFFSATELPVDVRREDEELGKRGHSSPPPPPSNATPKTWGPPTHLYDLMPRTKKRERVYPLPQNPIEHVAYRLRETMWGAVLIPVVEAHYRKLHEAFDRSVVKKLGAPEQHAGTTGCVELRDSARADVYRGEIVAVEDMPNVTTFFKAWVRDFLSWGCSKEKHMHMLQQLTWLPHSSSLEMKLPEATPERKRLLEVTRMMGSLAFQVLCHFIVHPVLGSFHHHLEVLKPVKMKGEARLQHVNIDDMVQKHSQDRNSDDQVLVSHA